MGKIQIEVGLMSARGLKRTSSFWKLQWYAVGWIDPNDKYCTKIDSSGNVNPVWRTKFSALVDKSEPDFQDLALHVEVYSRDPIFLREKLLGTASVLLKEFLDKYENSSESSKKPVEELGSFQLRKKNSNKPQGFIDISIRISEENEEPGDYGGFKLADHSNGITFQSSSQAPENHPPANSQYTHPMPMPTNYYHPPIAGPSYHLPQAPPPAIPGYTSSFLARPNNAQSSYINMPSSGAAPARGVGPGFGAGLGVGGLVAGSMMFGNEFMSGFDLPSGLQGASLTISTDPPF